MRAMEHAIDLTPAQIYKISRSRLRKYDAVYLGSEFCQNIVPSMDDIKYVQDKFAVKAVLVTSILSDQKLGELKRLIKKMIRAQGTVDIVVNDVGLLHFLDANYKGHVNILMGRPVALDLIRMSVSYLESFFKRYNIKMLETDENDLVEGLPPDTRIKVSFHHPLRYAAMTRCCPFEKTIEAHCGYSCEGRTVKLSHPKLPEPYLTLKNNAYFLSNKICRHKAVARLVYTPVR